MKVTEYPTDRECKAVVLKDKSTVVIYQVRNEETQEDEWFCSDANSTAYKYPLADATVFPDWKGKGTAVQSKLDGTVYSLETGGVLEWCPKNTLLRKILGTLKTAQNPVPLKVYPTMAENGTIYCKFAPGS